MNNEQQKIYQLYHNKAEAALKVSPIAKMFLDTYVDKGLANQPQDYVLYYNSYYYFSFSRKALVQKAREIKEEWIEEAEKVLEMYKGIKI